MLNKKRASICSFKVKFQTFLKSSLGERVFTYWLNIIEPEQHLGTIGLGQTLLRIELSNFLI